eukprot:TRINITY_DN596_c0_g1_i6.p1 TRINITY_DN596_c0_g1~~TRINITY_DN596_c0_g1_i6.p1  ORF type:complete len:362 (-),score=81.55 TRINITY_DN596_c0_g1_i6:20-1105(-)
MDIVLRLFKMNLVLELGYKLICIILSANLLLLHFSFYDCRSGNRFVWIFVNFLGIGVESAIVKDVGGDSIKEWLELPNGCICCTVRDDLVIALETMIEKRDSFDYIFIETTGIADPGPLATSLWLDDELGSSLYLDSIITLVDAKNFLKSLEEERPDGAINEAQRQVAFADVLIINKKDLVTEEHIKELQERIESINPIAVHSITEYSVVDLDVILHKKSFDMDTILDVDPELINQKKGHKYKEHDHDEDHSHNDSDRRNDVVTIAFTVKDPIDIGALNSSLAELLWENTTECDIKRMKAKIYTGSDDEMYILQAVHDNFDIQPSNIPWPENEPKESIFVIIGRFLNEELLKSLLIASPSA